MIDCVFQFGKDGVKNRGVVRTQRHSRVCSGQLSHASGPTRPPVVSGICCCAPRSSTFVLPLHATPPGGL
ncbi:hypothetical protein LOK49_LG03G03318 [Camellia lanceoleosa]|uniref:Uncharacterized protein n=1 Tax=Camellia lanceoleosa TaxID=1840588 RepID=A0ACC0IJ17_9ERIC|nr:hypothetical protein LOK49_LG03G03318 [Camellia lanceoleosa]